MVDARGHEIRIGDKLMWERRRGVFCTVVEIPSEHLISVDWHDGWYPTLESESASFVVLATSLLANPR